MKGQQVGFGHVLQVRPNEIVLPSRLPVKRVRNLEAVLARRKALARQFHELRHQVDPVRSDDESFLSRPDDQRLEQKAVRTADVEEVAVAVQRPNEESSCLRPTSSLAAPPGLLVLIARIREIELDNGVAKDTKVLVPRGVASQPPPPFPRGGSSLHDVSSRCSDRHQRRAERHHAGLVWLEPFGLTLG
jgi:hypothetical protein